MAFSTTGSLRGSRVGDALWELRLAKRHAIEETQRADRLVKGRPSNAGRDQMNLKGTDLLQPQKVRRAAKISTELRNRMKVGSLCRRRQITDSHVLYHPAA